MSIKFDDEERQEKIITIRGVNGEVYERFRAEIKSLGMNLGEAVTKMMNGVLTYSGDLSKSAANSLKNDLNKILVEDQRELTVNKNDLTEIENRFYFHSITQLKFDADVDLDTFMSKVIAIKACNNVLIPHYNIARLQLLSKFKFCDNIEYYNLND